MRHLATLEFWEAYDQLPTETRRVADRAFELIKRDPRHPSLHFKRVGRYWSVRVGRRYRAVAIKGEKGFAWFWIGTHSQYDALIGRRST